MPGYINPVTSSGNGGYLPSLNLTFPIDHSLFSPINSGIEALKDFLVARGWDLITPTFAWTLMDTIAIPFRDESNTDPFSVVPSDSRFFGIFDTKQFQLWDPFSTMGGPHGMGDEDPTGNSDSYGNSIVGVELGRSALGTLENFTAKFNAFSLWESTGIFLGDDLEYHFYVQAQTAGTTGNVDRSAPLHLNGMWEPNASMLASVPPREGGYILKSADNPFTSDYLTLWIYQARISQNMVVRVKFNDLTLELPTDKPVQQPTFLRSTSNHPMSAFKYQVHACPYQFAMVNLPGQSADLGDLAPTDGGGPYFLASALCVPDDFKATVKKIIHATDVSGHPLILQTGTVEDPGGGDPLIITPTPHNFTVGEVISIIGVGSGVDGKTRYVSAIVSDTEFEFRVTKAGSSYAGSGSLVGVDLVAHGAHVSTHGVSHVCAAFGSPSIRNSPFSTDGEKVWVYLNGEFQDDFSAAVRNGFVAAGLILINIGTAAVTCETSAAKPVIHAPYVALTTQPDEELRLAGVFWDGFVELKVQPVAFASTFPMYANVVTDAGDKRFVNWLQDTDTLRLVDCSLWFNAEAD